jgi:hypothetical protein
LNRGHGLLLLLPFSQVNHKEKRALPLRPNILFVGDIELFEAVQLLPQHGVQFTEIILIESGC